METVGSLIDKLSINELKIYHMQEQKLRLDATGSFLAECDKKLEILRSQKQDMTAELQEMIDDVLAGKRKIKLYRQLKMYNDKQYKK